MIVTLDTGVLVGLERGDPRCTRLLDRALQRGLSILIPATVVAQAWHSARQVRLARLFAADHVEVVPLSTEHARAIGLLLAATGTSDIVHGHVALVARMSDGAVITSDPDEIRRLAADLSLLTI
ncbi:MAG: PIN domain-containing protein [Mycobacteriales bacterium]